MESLSDTQWDVVIAGTGLSPSLLALALSRSDRKILHVDANEYYGGADAALSLQDAEKWVAQVQEQKGETSALFSEAKIVQSAAQSEPARDETKSQDKLGFSRAYSLALGPQIIYMRSAFLSMLVSSRIFRQLEFMAVGSWFVHEKAASSDEDENEAQTSKAFLRKIPNSREDVFADKSMGIKAKRSLISFQRLFRDPDEQAKVIEEHGPEPLQRFLTEQYNLPENLQEAINALTLSPEPPSKTTVAYSLPRIARHVTSMGVSGAGFSAVIPKWGGISEIAQVACRAQAVGGGIYMLGKGIKQIGPGSDGMLEASLSDDLTIKTRLVAGSPSELKRSEESTSGGSVFSSRSISIVSYTFDELFVRLAEDGPLPVVAVVSFPAGSLNAQGKSSSHPAYLMVHSAESGECPRGQCVIYGNITFSSSSSHDQELLQQAVHNLLDLYDQKADRVLWTLHYKRAGTSSNKEESKVSPDDPSPSLSSPASSSNLFLNLDETPLDLVLDDSLLRKVKSAWQAVIGVNDGDGGGFMTFEDREGAGEHDDTGEVYDDDE